MDRYRAILWITNEDWHVEELSDTDEELDIDKMWKPARESYQSIMFDSYISLILEDVAR